MRDIEQFVDRMFGLFNVSRDDVEFKIIDLPDWLGGYWTEPGLSDSSQGFKMESYSDSKATICIAKRYADRGDYRQFLRTLAHELQHHVQWTSGRMVFFSNLSDRTRGCLWEGSILIGGHKPHEEYLRDPWEVEARLAEVTMVHRYHRAYDPDPLERVA